MSAMIEEWNNFLPGIFQLVLRLFQNWNNIPSTNVADGIKVSQAKIDICFQNIHHHTRFIHFV